MVYVVRICLYISKKDHNKIKEHCKDYGKKVSPFMVRCTINYLNENKHLTEVPIRKRGGIFGFFGD